jgi:pyridoxal phosphate enzyme (YggS family)
MGSLKEDEILVAVSKTKPIDLINEAYLEGLRDFGENKVQELINKVEVLPQDIRWHFIGHLQRNKVKYIVGKVFLIHSLDSIRLLKELEKQYSLNKLEAHTLIEVNIGEEESKSGINRNQLEELLEECEKCSFVKVKGLMAIIPIGSEEKCRQYFRSMKEVFDTLSKRSFKNIEMKYLSMGMTNDYKIALEEGSNMIRVGTGIFGLRR